MYIVFLSNNFTQEGGYIMGKTFLVLCVCGFIFSHGVCADPCSGVSELGKEFINTVKEIQLEEIENPKAGELKMLESPQLKWESSCKCEVVYTSKNYASFKVFETRYTGGAHGGNTTTVGTFKAGKRVGFSDLYRSPQEKKQLVNLWKAAIARHFKVKSYEERLKVAGDVFKPFITDNFYLDNKGIHFIYNPYDIDCYAAGTIDIFVPWKMPR